ncbi:hypothetical protein PK28_08565 [Hymenobacter sp. DG25B]|nr:hypothetical protein PK28_08565 [Hymenobacter sp. DG25B]
MCTPARQIVKIVLSIACAMGASFLTILASPLGRDIDQVITDHFRHMNERRVAHRLTRMDVLECKVLFHAIAFAGRLVSQEGGTVVWHYLHGGGKDLWLDSTYLSQSPVILQSLNSLRDGESKRFAFQQNADWRLSYALNPFFLRRERNRAVLWQRIEFKDDLTTFTTLNYGLGNVRLADGLILALHPVPFTVRAAWSH